MYVINPKNNPRKMMTYACRRLHTRLCGIGQSRFELLSPDPGSFQCFFLFSPCRATARLHLKKKKSLENLSVAGVCSFNGTDFGHNDKGTAVNTVVFTMDCESQDGNPSVKTDKSLNLLCLHTNPSDWIKKDSR